MTGCRSGDVTVAEGARGVLAALEVGTLKKGVRRPDSRGGDAAGTIGGEDAAATDLPPLLRDRWVRVLPGVEPKSAPTKV
jgi:hypothetical protein